jgi:hypothetical protein
MSALPPEADIRQRIEHVCFVPVTDICVGDLEIGSPKTWKARPVHTLGELLNLMRRRRV